MKLVKQVTLEYREGTSDKVYEVDLCDVSLPRAESPQYVVNFRYGRRGMALRDGSKTPAPVTLEEAERIFDKLVSSKINKGYQHAGSSPAPSSEGPETSEIPEENIDTAGLDDRCQAVLRRLGEGHSSTSKWRLSRAVWRTGELRLRQAEPLLLRLIGTGDPSESEMLDYCLVWALAQCGSEKSVPTLRALMSDKSQPSIVRRLAREALLHLVSESDRATLIQSYLQMLPEMLVESASNGPAESFQQQLNEYLANGGKTSTIEVLYLINNEHVRPALLDLLRSVPLEPSYFQSLRHLFKTAELRRDGEVFGILAYRFERTRSSFANNSQGYYYGSNPPKKKTIGPNAEKAFSHETRYYLRRRVWRTIQRIGSLSDTDYVRMAVGLLLPYTDEDAQPPRQEVRYDWSSYVRNQGYQTTTTHWDAYGAYWAFCQVLYANSPRYAADKGKRYFACVPPYQPGGEVPTVREEAFPNLWEAAPQGLLHLLDESRCEPVHEFAAKALRACDEFCQGLGTDVLLMLLSAPYDATASLGFDLAVSRYDPLSPDRELVLALANCRLERARTTAHGWIQANRQAFFEDDEFTVGLVASPQADTRALARESLRLLSMDETRAQTLVVRLMAMLQSLGEGDGRLAADIAETMLRAFGRPLRRIGAEVIRDLLEHPLPEIQQFAGDLILEHEQLSQHPPEDLLRALLASEFPQVREVGVKIIGQLPDPVLTGSIELLFALSRHEHADIREAIRPITKRLILADSQFATRLAEMLVEGLLIPGAPEGVPSHTSQLLREELRDHLSTISPKMVWKLLQSRSAPAQEVGGILLPTHIKPSELTVDEMVKLAGNDVLAVRQSACQMCSESIDRLRTAMATTVKLLDVKWEDSREFAVSLFRDHFTQAELTPSVLVAICDSVRPEVQQFGREMITRFFQEELGEEYLMKLSEHPAASIQMFATNFLERYASDSPHGLDQLTPYFLSVLSRVNKGRVAKDRVLTFLGKEAMKSREAAERIARLIARQSATAAIGDKAEMIEIMVRIQEQYPDIALPLEFETVEVRDGI